MEWMFALVAFAAIIAYFFRDGSRPSIAVLPERFVVFDIETTGLDSAKHEIIEIGAILVNRDSDQHQSFQALVRPSRKVPAKITHLTGITQDMVDKDGEALDEVLPQFLDFINGLPLVAYNAAFDMGFIHKAIANAAPHRSISNQVTCALKLARQAWPERQSFRLADICRDGGMSTEGKHRALADCKNALTVYSAAALTLGRSS